MSPRRVEPHRRSSPASRVEVPRVLLARVPAWTLKAARAVAPQDSPLIVIEAGRVVACCDEAAAEGVVPGLRLREAQLRCPHAVVAERDQRIEDETFESVVDAVEQIVPEAHIVRPGVVAVRARGPARFYGGEQQAARHLWQGIGDIGYPDATVSVADGLFGAERAAEVARPIAVVPVDGTPEFLSGLNVGVLGEPDLARTLQQLGLHTLGSFAALDTSRVRSRFGSVGLAAHRLAKGLDGSPLTPRARSRGHGVGISFDEPLYLAEQVTASVAGLVGRLVADLNANGLVCTQVCIMVRTASGVSERTWRHPWQFAARDIVSRLAWQLEELSTTSQDEPSGVLAVQFVPTTHPAGEHAEGLFGDRPAEHLMHVLTRLQDAAGPNAVLASSVVGGRLCKERRALTPFGSVPPNAGRHVEQPWPGRLTGPAPATVLARPEPAAVHTSAGEPLALVGGELNGEPGWLATERGKRRPVIAWAGPWPVRQRWWDERAISLDRLQVVTADQHAWLLVASGDRWWVEAHYDEG